MGRQKGRRRMPEEMAEAAWIAWNQRGMKLVGDVSYYITSNVG